MLGNDNILRKRTEYCRYAAPGTSGGYGSNLDDENFNGFGGGMLKGVLKAVTIASISRTRRLM